MLYIRLPLGYNKLMVKLHKGARVRFLRDVERYPDGLVPKGAEGTVVAANTSLIAVFLDYPTAGFHHTEWDNCVRWYPWNVPEHAQEIHEDLEVLS